MSRLQFEIQAQATGSRARAARFKTLHNEVLTPLFMPVGTNATVRTQTVDLLESSGSQILLANTYHLMLRPGAEVFKQFGGVHRFMNWKKSVLTDSGGFQIFSLAGSRTMREEGAHFQSHLSPDPILISPETSIEMQKAINSDIMMVLDQCIPSTADHASAELAMQLTHRWAKRSLDARGDSLQSLFGIVQGACFQDLRKISAEVITEMPFDGFAIGGLAVGEGKEQREDITEWTTAFLPKDKPRYLMGVGTPIDLLEAVHRGVDMFDCIIPTALAQQGVAFTSKGEIRLRRGAYRLDESPLDAECTCLTCRNYTKAYLYHLIKIKELLGWQLIASHNIHFYHSLMQKVRESILQDRFMEFYHLWRPILGHKDSDPVARAKAKPKKPEVHYRELGQYEVMANSAGGSSIRQISSGEVMHSVNDPNEEAQRLYIEQSHLAQKLQKDEPELVIWDVGLGAATNAMAAIRCYEETAAQSTAPSLRALHIVSFENDLDSLRLATRHAALFPHLKHAAPHILLEKGEWQSKTSPLNWTLLEGDFLRTLYSAPAPDLIFYDPFSFRTDSTLWTPECFKKVFSRCRERYVELFTYSGSTAVRVALLTAGFFVASGRSSGPKSETTIAISPALAAEGKRPLLGEEWLTRWKRSEARLKDQDEMILKHAQFMKLFRNAADPSSRITQ